MNTGSKSHREGSERKLRVKGKRKILTRLASVEPDDPWDRQIAADAKAGRLDPLWHQALEDIQGGKTTPLDEVLKVT